ncbi:MAG TPA: hypothetical protein VF584_11730 [Longimicrobium sp.]|jgi:hypothetical protein
MSTVTPYPPETVADPRGGVDTVPQQLAARTALVQSPYLYLQAAGSDGSDGSASGIHLRWDLLRGVGETHLPKGNLASGTNPPYSAPYGFNRPDDFVVVLRAPYRRRACVVKLAKDRPAAVVEAGTDRRWTYHAPVEGTTPPRHRDVVLRFADLASYDAVRAGVDPRTSPGDFLGRYGGMVEVEVTDRLCFALTLVMRTVGEGREAELRVEAVSVTENLPDAERVVSCRKRFVVVRPPAPPPSPPPPLARTAIGRLFAALLALLGVRTAAPAATVPAAAALPEHRVCAENVRYFRFACTRSAPGELHLETYDDFILGALATDDGWRPVGRGFALTERDALAFDRLETPAAPVDRRWPRYLFADPGSGRFTTSVANYRARWDPTLPPLQEPDDGAGLRAGVQRYLALSTSPANAAASDALPADDPRDGGAFGISYLVMLKLVALDFHVARMLGLGCIDTGIPRESAAQFVHLALYHTTAALEPGGAPGQRTHLSMSLPTGRKDHRLPPAPVQAPPTFGISIDNGTATPTQLTDDDGYTPFDEARVVHLNLEPYDTVQPLGPFFVPPVEFCSCEVTKPVLYGCKYRRVGESDWRVPELSSDDEMHDLAGVAEVAPLLPQLATSPGAPRPPIYTHRERENGLHRYTLYGVNWFSRPSPLGNPRDVDTQIPVHHTLLPPSNLGVQLIQPEDPILLTTPAEQQRLAGLAGDRTLVRCTFEWNHTHYRPQKPSAAGTWADRVQLFFRQEPPRAVQGAVKSVTSLSDRLVEVRTEPYTLASVSPPRTVTPAVTPGDEPRFAGSTFAANQVLYLVESVAQPTMPGEGAVFRVRKQVQSGVADLDHSNHFSATVQVKAPAPGERFLVVENLNEPATWGPSQPLAHEVALVTFLQNGQFHTETVTHADGTQTVYNVGGVHASATVTERNAVDPSTGLLMPGTRTGVYEIQFDTFQLAPHPDADVEWCRGTVRIADAASGEPRALAVWTIDTSGTTLRLVAHDAAFQPPSGSVPAPSPAVQTGTGVMVNFHPGYRVYLTAQPGVLDEGTTLPPPLHDTKQTLLAARARNTALPSDSDLTTPVVMQGRRITPPLPPDPPSGPRYATEPDVYGKGSYTMDVGVQADATREPYALLFYRANEQSVLDVLYQPATVDAIRTALAALPAEDAAYFADRWNDLVNVHNLHGDHGFNEYTPGGFRFPTPDNGAYVIPGTQVAPFGAGTPPGDPTASFVLDGVPASMAQVVRRAIEGVFLPLTESPVIFRFIRQGTQTSARKPVIRDANGDLLPFGSPGHDPSPMVVRHMGAAGETRVRFTDYTLDGAARNFYFYAAGEMTDQMRLGPRSAATGPVLLVDASPAQAPAIRSVTTLIEDPLRGVPTGVKLVMSAYLASEGITRFNLYRATSAADAASPRSMTLVGAYPAAAGGETEIVDTFADLPFPPFGDPLFYRVTALREITNERGETVFVPSQPSTLARASVIDVESPVAPAIAFSSNPPTVSMPVLLTGVELSWRRVTHNATYRLYRQDATGNWTLIHEVKTNADPVVVPLAATALGSDVLSKLGSDGTPIRHCFAVEVENSSGMLSRNQNVLSVPAACLESAALFQPAVSYADNHQPAAPLGADRLVSPTASPFPGSMTFSDAIASLPPGHVFDRTEVSLADGLGNAVRLAISSPGGSVTFAHGDGTGIVLDGSVSNLTYDVRVRVFTDACTDGLRSRYRLRYGPDVDLLGLGGVLAYTDSLNTLSPLEDPYVAEGVQFPTTMTFTDVTSLPAGHTFAGLEVEVRDSAGATFTQTINVPGGSVTFQHGDSGLALDASLPDRTYEVTARLLTDLSPGGVPFTYVISYP